MSQGQILLEGQSPGHFLTRMSWDVGQLRYGLVEALVMTSHISDAASAGEKAHCVINCGVIRILQWVKIVCFKKDTIPTTLFQTICSDFWVCIGCILMITAFDIFQQAAKLYLNIWKVIGTCVCSVFLKHRGTLLALLLIRFWVTVEKCLEVGEMLKSVQK